MTQIADFTAVHALAGDLTAQAVKVTPAAVAAVGLATKWTAARATANAASYGGTGELAGSVESELFTAGAPTGRVTADPRQAHFLTYGSPNTGAPRPWLDGPAQQAQEALLNTLKKAVDA